MLESVSLKDLQSLVTAKGKLDKLLEQKSSIEKDLASVDSEIAAIRKSLGKPGPGKAPAKTAPVSRKKRARRKKTGQPSIQTLIVEILREKKKPLSVNEISDILLKEKKYKTKSANFKNQLRVLLYRNDKGLFTKAGTGKFGLKAAGQTPAAKAIPVAKKASSKKKKTAARKKTAVKKVAAKKKAVKKAVKKTTRKATSPKKKKA